ncbi:MAG: hypothetical protein V3T24_11355 [Longimicrobiales bacterium]
MSKGRTRRLAAWFQALMVVPLVVGCASAAGLPEPRSLVVRSGARLTADRARMAEIDRWVLEETLNII